MLLFKKRVITRALVIGFLCFGLFGVALAKGKTTSHHKSTRHQAVKQETNAIDLNEADVKTLSNLKGIGKKKQRRLWPTAKNMVHLKKSII